MGQNHEPTYCAIGRQEPGRFTNIAWYFYYAFGKFFRRWLRASGMFRALVNPCLDTIEAAPMPWKVGDWNFGIDIAQMKWIWI